MLGRLDLEVLAVVAGACRGGRACSDCNIFAAMTPPMLRPLSVGEILDTSFSLYRRHFGALATVALVCTGIPLLLRLFLEASGGLLHQPAAVRSSTLLSLVVLNLVATGATVFIVSESYLGRPISAREALRRATPYIGRILVCSLLMALVIGLGLPAARRPGVILAVGLALAIPAVVLEPRHERQRGAVALVGADPRGRAGGSSGWAHAAGAALRAARRDHRPLRPRAAAGAGSASGRPRSRSSRPSRSAALVQMFIYPLFYCVLTVTYYDLRVRKEGFDLELLASTLQTRVSRRARPRRPTPRRRAPGGARQRLRRAGLPLGGDAGAAPAGCASGGIGWATGSTALRADNPAAFRLLVLALLMALVLLLAHGGLGRLAHRRGAAPRPEAAALARRAARARATRPGTSARRDRAAAAGRIGEALQLAFVGAGAHARRARACSGTTRARRRRSAPGRRGWRARTASACAGWCARSTPTSSAAAPCAPDDYRRWRAAVAGPWHAPAG